MTQPVASKSTVLSRRQIVWLTLTLAIAMDTVVQLCWKFAIEQVPDTVGLWQSVAAILHEPLFHVALVVFFMQFFNWMIVLAHADLSYAQPITALSYVTVSAASMVLFQEQLSPLRMVGLTLIMVGVWVISRTNVRTAGIAPVQDEDLVTPEATR
ncbi:MAG: EamA family transporter [Nitrospirae bacterium]|nr:EamA family transporter [Nitrospirota bacterium]